MLRTLYARYFAWSAIRRARRLVREATTSDRRTVEIVAGGRRLQLETNASNGISDWSGVTQFRFWKRKLQFVIFVDDSPPKSQQLSYLGELMTTNVISRDAIEQRIFRYYTNDITPQGPVDWEMKPLPVAKTLKQLRRSISGPTLYLDNFEEEPTCSLEFCADWDDEHGIRVNLNKYTIEHVGR